MLELIVPAREKMTLWDEVNETFIELPARNAAVLQLEHSLIALSKWESKWCKPFLDRKEKTEEETIDYIRCMTLNRNVDDDVYYRLTPQNYADVEEYIKKPMTATTINRQNRGGKKGVNRSRLTTSELIYSWMISLQIPVEFQKWHLNRLLTLIEVCDAENTPPEKMSKTATAQHYAALNAARRKKYNSKG